MKKDVKPSLKKVKFIDIIREVNKELEDLYGLEVVSDILQTTRKVMLKHILYNQALHLDIFNIADFYIYKDKITNPMLLSKGSSDEYIRFTIKPRKYIKRFVKKKIISADTPPDIEDIFKTGSTLIDDDVDMDFL